MTAGESRCVVGEGEEKARNGRLDGAGQERGAPEKRIGGRIKFGQQEEMRDCFFFFQSVSGAVGAIRCLNDAS